MRLDKYLKVSRLIKRRTVAKDFAENDKVMINGRLAKPSTELKIGDQLVIQLGNRRLQIEVVALNETARANEASGLYRVISDEMVPRD
ncbi:MAG: RNA-binding S4 domain-containing protein [Solirubrobacterales bacterium]